VHDQHQLLHLHLPGRPTSATPAGANGQLAGDGTVNPLASLRIHTPPLAPPGSLLPSLSRLPSGPAVPAQASVRTVHISPTGTDSRASSREREDERTTTTPPVHRLKFSGALHGQGPS
jgi:hypothetical protein